MELVAGCNCQACAVGTHILHALTGLLQDGIHNVGPSLRKEPKLAPVILVSSPLGMRPGWRTYPHVYIYTQIHPYFSSMGTRKKETIALANTPFRPWLSFRSFRGAGYHDPDPKLGLRAPIFRIIAFWGLSWGPLI